MSNLTPKLEEQFEQIKDLLMRAWHGESVSSALVRDLVLDLEVEVEEALAKAGQCAICETELAPLCAECLEEEATRWDDWRDELSLKRLVSVGAG